MTIALATNIANHDPPTTYAVQVLFPDTFEGTHVLEDFMLPAEASYNPLTRFLDITQAPPADCYQVTFRDDNNTGWHIFDTSPNPFYLPTVSPEGYRIRKAKLYSLDLKDGVTYQDLPAFNETNLGSLIELVKAFAVHKVTLQ